MSNLLQLVPKSEPADPRFEFRCDDCETTKEVEMIAACLWMVEPQHRWPKCKQCGETMTLWHLGG